MLATFTILLSAASVMANNHNDARSHSAIAQRINNSTFSLGKRATYTNKEFTWYPTDTGPDACTGQNHQDSDFYVAMGFNQYGDGSACCNRQLSITVNGKTATATCVDECASCPEVGQLDFTKGLFEYFTGGDLGVGEIFGDWSYVDGSSNDGGDDDTTTTTKKTTAAPKPTTTSTTTKKTTTSTHAPTTTTHSSSKASSSSKKASSSSAKPSSSSAKPSSAKASASASPSPSAAPSAAPSPSPSPASAPVPTAAQGVANAGSAGEPTTVGTDGISGALTGSGTSGASVLSFNKFFATIAVVALVAAQL
ncbi:hypothetical protein K438DRAFT_1778627 [Mycena galopus ATCC 62051]|nr:hypothetical protein K438DRAFT_1778627 [Mycena galopus ATCC 62051]